MLILVSVPDNATVCWVTNRKVQVNELQDDTNAVVVIPTPAKSVWMVP